MPILRITKAKIITMEINIDNFKGNNKIVNAYKSNKTGVVLDSSPNNPFRLHRFKKKYNVEVTGKQVGDQYVIVFWDKLTSIIK